MSRFVRIFKSSVGCKAVMALTGFALVLFVIQHCIANLQIYNGQAAMNDYAAMLKGLGPALWVARGGLLAIFLLHVLAGFRLYRINTAARKDRYQFNALVQEDPLTQVRVRAATFMFLTGLVVFLFVVYHLAHFTFGWINADAFAENDENFVNGKPDVYSMFILGFQNKLIAITYVLFMLVLGAHLIHGFSSAFQSLGWNHPAFNKFVRYGCPAVVVIIVGLNMMMPLTIMFGYPALPESSTSSAEGAEPSADGANDSDTQTNDANPANGDDPQNNSGNAGDQQDPLVAPPVSADGNTQAPPANSTGGDGNGGTGGDGSGGDGGNTSGNAGGGADGGLDETAGGDLAGRDLGGLSGSRNGTRKIF